MKKFLILALLAFSKVSGYACLNEFYTASSGEKTPFYFSLRVFYRSFDTSFSQAYVDYYDLNQKDTMDYHVLSDISVHLAKLKRYDESLQLLLWLYQRHPDDYSINANLGTLYELTGNINSAYYFIERAIQINPQSHGGSEWVHLEILKAKKEIEKAPDWLSTERVLDLQLDEPAKRPSKAYDQVMDTLEDISYQLYERVPFTPVPDPVLADIFDELGDLLARHYSVEQAYIAYAIALEYGADKRLGTAAELEAIFPLVKESKRGIPDMDYYFPAPAEYAKQNEEMLPGKRTKTRLNADNSTPLFQANSSQKLKVTPWAWVIIAATGTTFLGLILVRLYYRKR